jgi:hypothetical protein
MSDPYEGELSYDKAAGVISGWMRDELGWGMSWRTIGPPVDGKYRLVGKFLKPSHMPDIPGVDTEL